MILALALLFVLQAGVWTIALLRAQKRLAARGKPPRSPRQLWFLIAYGVLTAAATSVAVYEILDGRAWIGLVLLVVVFVVPELVLTPVRVRRAQRRAAAARARREAGN